MMVNNAVTQSGAANTLTTVYLTLNLWHGNSCYFPNYLEALSNDLYTI